MQKVPQIVHKRLKAATSVVSHPDADMLTAFAERSLSDRERAGVLGHLAACAGCREIVALALPPTEGVATASVVLRRSWFAWPAFRWGFATAGAVLIVLAAVRFEHYKGERSAVVARQIVAAPVTAQVQNPTASQSMSRVPAGRVSDNTPAKKETRKIAEGKPFVKLTNALPQISPGAKAPSPAFVGRIGSAAKQAPNGPVPPASQMVAVQSQNEVVEVQSAESQVAQAPVPNSFVDQSYNTGPLSRAKPADIEPVPSGVAGTMLAATPRWSITALGGLQRSLDQGKSWQDISVDASAVPSPSGAAAAVSGPARTAAAKQNSIQGQADYQVSFNHVFFRAVTAAGNDVWAGGSDAALFHSMDGGEHWRCVLPSFSGSALTGDVVSVEFSDPRHGTVTTSTPEIWVTIDGGQNWQKQ